MSKTFYIKSGDRVEVSTDSEIQISDKIEPGTYTLIEVPFLGLRLQKSKDLDFKNKVYGNVDYIATRIWNTAKSRNISTGFLLSGDKGSGKTMTTKLLAKKAMEEGHVTLIINSPFVGEQFNRIIQLLPDNSIILFDEFEKVYNKVEYQTPILSLLDGLYSSKKIFILTVNDMSKMNEFLLNRPGRLFYNVPYKGLSAEFIREFGNDVLVNKNFVEELVSLSEFIDPFTFDMLNAIVEESNRYNENPTKTLDWLNIRRTIKYDRFKVKFIKSKEKNILSVKTEFVDITFHPDRENHFGIDVLYDEKTKILRKIFNSETKKYDETIVEENISDTFEFSTSDFRGIREKDQAYIFENELCYVELQKVKKSESVWKYNYSLAF